ncbi:MFS transporter [Knoellia remsis]|uniref:MFS transporter n=1 Tax=Knoellia remsis TaxID=407159 RepID=A0A2T0UJS9_9MICO|nr:MFS transporter [Knoellia remsis]PRY58199.1 MFS transporter [Knoellia remsis]
MTTTSHAATEPGTGPDGIPTHADGARTERERLFSAKHLPVAAGIVALVTLGAFENRATIAILPTAARALDGLAWFGPANAAPMVTFMVAVVVAGRWVDRAGARTVLVTGLVTFVAAQLVTAAAPSMAVFVLGRAISGVAEGLIDVSTLVFAARALPEHLRAKVFATFAAAWIVPSLVGPGVAGVAESLVGWRLVFLLPSLLVAPLFAVLLPGLRRVGSARPAEGTDAGAAPLAPAVGLAAAVALLSVGGPLAFDGGPHHTAGLATLTIGSLALVATVRSALPAGTLTAARGIPAVVALRTLLVIAFGGIGGFLPLMLDVTQGVGPAVAGISLTITGVFWAVGSAVHSLDAVQRRLDAAARVRLGLTFITVGGVGPVLLSLGIVGLVPGMVGWALAATGMGLASPSLATEIFVLAPEHEQGRATAASQVGASLGSALTTVGGGALVAARHDSLDGGVFALIMGMSLAAAVIALTVTSRMRA